MLISAHNRRQFMARSAVATFAALIGVPSRSYALLPAITAYQAATIVVGALQAISGANTQQDIASKLAQISAKLDLVLSYQSAIIEELKAIATSISKIPQDIDIHNINGLAQQYMDAFNNSKPNSSDVRAVKSVASNLSGNLGGDDYIAFSAYLSAVNIKILCAIFLGVSRQDVRKLKDDSKPAIQRWIDPASPSSITSDISKLNSSISNNLAFINDPADKVSSAPRDSRGSTMACSWTETTYITGNLQNGFDGHVETSGKTCHDTNPCPHHDCLFGKDLTLSIPNNQILSTYPPQPENSQIPLVNQFRSVRNQIIVDSDRLSQLSDIKTQMDLSLKILTQ